MNKRSLVTVAAGIAILALGFFVGQQWSGSGTDESMALDTGGEALRAGPFRVQVTVNPETPVIGANTVRLRLTDSQGVPVEGATISVVAIMPAMNPMPEMRAFAEITQGRASTKAFSICPWTVVGLSPWR